MQDENPTDSAQEPGPQGSPLLAAIRSRGFLFAFLGWYLVNGILFFIISNGTFQLPTSGETGPLMVALCLFPLNLGLLLVLAIRKDSRRVAGGLLAAIALNFVVSLILGLMLNATCFLPFFVKTV